MKTIIKYISVFTILSIMGLLLFDLVALPIITKSNNNIFIPDVRNKSSLKAISILNSLGFRNEIIVAGYNQILQPNTVISMSPRPFSKVKYGKVITLTVSGDKDIIVVDDFYNMSLTNAKLMINRQSLILDTIIYEYNKDINKNYISSQFPKVGKVIKTNDKISFVVSKGNPPNYYSVPNVINMNIDKAKILISDAGLQIGIIEYEYNYDYLNNTVLEQSITPDVKLSFPKKINLIISTDNKE